MINIKYWNAELNLGDQLSPIIVDWIMREKEINDASEKIINLMAVGSILAAKFFDGDSVVWGSGIHYIEDSGRLAYQSIRRNLDIRAVRGPITRRALEQAGYLCPHIYGDPAILMPLIYRPEKEVEAIDCAVIRQLGEASKALPPKIKQIEIQTSDYKSFIDEIISSRKIISSSLHGIILAECYHIPAIWLVEHESKEFIKFFDWYYSTGRTDIKIVHSVEEGINVLPMALPNLDKMRNQLINAFPSDIFKCDYSHIAKMEVVLFGVGTCFFYMIDKIKENVFVRYVCDNDCSKWGKCFSGLHCIAPMQLKKMENIYVVITMTNPLFIAEVASQLEGDGIFFYEGVNEWIGRVNYEKYC